MEITEKMVLALLRKGFEYELEDAEMEIEIPLSAENESMMKMNIKCTGLKMRISQDD